MPNEAQIRRRMEQWLQSVRQKVVNGYWEVILVGGFSYTIGLTQFNHPEVLVCGLRPQNAGIALNYVGLQIRDHGAVFKAGDTVVMEPFEGNFTFGFRALDPEVADQLAAQAHNVYGRRVEVLQLVYADQNNLLPWDEGVGIRYVNAQDPRQFLQ